MTTWARRAAALLVAAALLGSGGCLWVAAGAAAGAAAAGYAYLSAPVYREYPASPTDTGKAVETALAEMQLTLVHKETTGDGLAFEARADDDKPIKIELHNRPSPIPAEGSVTRVSVRVATFGDEAVSQRVLDQVGLHLMPTPTVRAAQPPQPDGRLRPVAVETAPPPLADDPGWRPVAK
jgi:hypothetical protein